MRQASLERTTRETQIKVALVLEGQGQFQGQTGVGFLDHMLELWAKHSGFNLTVEAQGDVQVDDHHTVEDLGLSLGQLLREALGDKKGITRYGSLALPMDECLVLCAVDISGRPGYYSKIIFKTEKIGSFDTELVAEFWRAFTNEAKITLHLQELAGGNSHHLAEAIFKGVGRVLGEAVRITGEGIPSTKGVL